MSEHLDCTDMAAHDLLPGYVAGTLSAEDAEHFEAHYLGCQSCWEQLQAALAARAVLEEPAAAEGYRSQDSQGASRRRVVGWLASAAAAVLVLSAAAWLSRSKEPPEPISRGAAEIPVTAAWQENGSLVLTWPVVSGADAYHVRVLREGLRPWTGDTTEPSLIVGSEDLAGASELSVVVTVQNVAGDVIARSRPTSIRRN